MMAKCMQCGAGFEAKRSTAKYCSAQCRKLAFQNGNENAKKEVVTTKQSPIAPTSPQTVHQDCAGAAIPAGPIPEHLYKRGTDIKCFEDLLADVQADITRLSRSYTALDGKLVNKEQDLADRTARAIHYQHLFPDRFYPGGREVMGAPIPDNLELCRYCPEGPALQPYDVRLRATEVNF